MLLENCHHGFLQIINIQRKPQIYFSLPVYLRYSGHYFSPSFCQKNLRQTSLICLLPLAAAAHTAGPAHEAGEGGGGEHDKTEGQHQGEHAVSAILPHPAYTAAPPYPHDAALLTLAAPLTFSARVAPVCLPAAASLYAGRVATVTGWGSTLVLGASSAVLREANVTIIANEECGEAFSDSFDSPWIKKYFAKTLTSSFIYAIL